MKAINSLYIYAVLMTTGNSFAVAADDSGQRRRGPPQVAIDACSERSEGDACSFTGRGDRNLEGTCFAPPQGDQIACRPANHESGRRERRGDSDDAPPES